MLKLLFGRKNEADSSREVYWRERIDPLRLPRHIAIIMDGNGRWAQRQGLPRTMGHRAGVEALRKIVRLAAELEIGVLTLFAFSTENWRRPSDEVNFLMNLLCEYVQRELAELSARNIRLMFIGERDSLPAAVREAMAGAEKGTKNNTGLVVNLAVNYGGRREIVSAARAIAAKVRTGSLNPEDIDEVCLAQHLFTKDLPDPDLLIRPSGEMRISNFLLWQIAYTELWMTSVAWPDFTPAHLLQAIAEFQQRERRFGGINNQT